MYNLDMIGFLRGLVHYVDNDFLLLDVNNVGYRINFVHGDKVKLNEEVLIYTYQSVREDDISLFGFMSLEEYELFIKLISVKGLGPKTAMNILRRNSVEAIRNAIESNDVAFIKAMPGIGAKTASQIILDLKGKLIPKESIEEKVDNPVYNDSRDALVALGYKPIEINKVLKKIDYNSLTVNEVIRQALKSLSK